MQYRKSVTKCAFCSYYVGNECTAAKAGGQVNTYFCKQAQYEYNQWLSLQQKNKASFSGTKPKYFKY